MIIDSGKSSFGVKRSRVCESGKNSLRFCMAETLETERDIPISRKSNHSSKTGYSETRNEKFFIDESRRSSLEDSIYKRIPKEPQNWVRDSQLPRLLDFQSKISDRQDNSIIEM